MTNEPKKRVLVVDDEEDVRNYLATVHPPESYFEKPIDRKALLAKAKELLKSG